MEQVLSKHGDFNTGHVKEEMIPWYQGGNSQYPVGSTYDVHKIQTLVKKRNIYISHNYSGSEATIKTTLANKCG